MVKIERGKTIFDSNAQTLVNTINCVGVMGKGIALEFKNKYPAMFDKYKSFCDKGVFKPGVLWIYKAEDGKWILNFPTKVDWKNPSEMSYIEAGLQKFVEIWKEKNITSIAFPLLGCSNGGLNPEEVIPLMEKYLNQCDGLDVTIYDNRPQEVEAPKVNATDEFFGDENPKDVVEEAKPLVEEEPIEISDEEIVKAVVQIQEVKSEPENEEDDSEKKPIQIDKIQVKEGTFEIKSKTSEEEQMLKHLVNEKNAMQKEIDDALNEFVGKENTPQTRAEATKKIINTINCRGFPMWSVFQI